MANKERNKRSARQARQRERAEREAIVAEQAANSDSKAKKAAASNAKKSPVKVQSSGKTGFISRVRNYLFAVRNEMRRVTWPSKQELTNYSVAVVAMLIIFGIAVWLIDTGFVAALVGFTSLRG